MATCQTIANISMRIRLRGVEPQPVSMESASLFQATTVTFPAVSPVRKISPSVFPNFCREFRQPLSHALARLSAVKSPRGFGTSPEKLRKKSKKKKGRGYEVDDDDEDDDDDFDAEPEDGTIPEVVTNRMMTRMGLSVGIPLVIGLLFFPFFYYLKVVQKVDVPTWVPFIVSFFFFGSALFGVSYGIVSSSWDPLREGSLLGWNEAQRNWPVFWQSLWGKSGKK